MAITGAITNFATGSYTVTRTAAGSSTDGVWTDGATSTLSVVASVQPMDSSQMAELQTLPEGERTADLRVVYSIDELKSRSATHGPDRLTINGESYEVVKVDRWDAPGTTHYRSLVSRVEPA